MIEIMNLRNTKPSQPYDVKIDRSSVLGNPFTLGSESERAIRCNEYEKYIKLIIKQHSNLDITGELVRLFDLHLKHGQLRLFCWCAPKRCHGDTIKEILEAELNE